MKIVKNKKQLNKFSIEGLTAGKLMAIHKALEEAKANKTLGPTGEDVLVMFNNQRKDFIHG